MKIALFTPYYWPSTGGVQSSIKLWAEYFVGKGHSVHVYTSDLAGMEDLRFGQLESPKRFLPFQVLNGVQIHRSPSGGILNFLLGLLYVLLNKLGLSSKGPIWRMYMLHFFRKSSIVKAIRKWDPDWIFAAPCTDFIMEIAQSARRGSQASLAVHSSLHLSDEFIMNLKPAIKRLQDADVILANTVFEKEYLITEGIEIQRVHVTGPPIDAEGFLSKHGDHEVDIKVLNKVSGKKYVLSICRKQEGKGLKELIEAVQLFRKKTGYDLHLVLAGEETCYFKENLRPLIENQAHIHDLDTVQSATKKWLYENALIFSMVSDVDSFGIVYCESWLCGKAVIAADNGQMHCVIHDGETGFLVPYGDAAALCNVLIKAWDDPHKLHPMGEKGRHETMKQFSGQAVQKKVLEILTQVNGE